MTSTWKISTNGRVLTRDNVKITDHSTAGLSPAERLALADAAWTLSRAYPVVDGHPVRVTVKPGSAPDFAVDPEILRQDPGASIDGATLQGSRIISLNERLWTEPRNNGVGNMPISYSTPRWLYVLTHEFGHASDETILSYPEFLTFLQFASGLSGYGQSEPAEGYAEAFAEWVLTQGRTTNRASWAYAKRFGWRTTVLFPPNVPTSLPRSETPNPTLPKVNSYQEYAQD